MGSSELANEIEAPYILVCGQHACKTCMNRSCLHEHAMNTVIQIRNVPAVLHRRLKARAAIEGLSMSRYIMREMEKVLDRPSRRELLEAIRAQPEAVLNPSPAEILRAERGSR